MTKQEKAINIIKQFSDGELDRFITYFSIIYPINTDADGMTEKQRALEEIKSIIRPIPDLDEKKELAEYRKEKYGE